MLNQSINFYTFLLLIFVSSQAKSGSLGFSNENVPLFESHVSGDAGNHGTVILPLCENWLSMDWIKGTFTGLSPIWPHI